MDALNSIFTAIFDVLCAPSAWVGEATVLILLSGVFGVLALLVFKHISFQKRIARTKNLIKAHLIEIRIYQDNLRIVSVAILKVLGRNLQYLGLNFLPFLPLSIPFAFVLAQLVTRFAYAPMPVEEPQALRLAGHGVVVEVQLADPARYDDVTQLKIEYPQGIKAVSPLVRVPFEGRAYQEIAVMEAGSHTLKVQLGEEVQDKRLDAGLGSGMRQAAREQGWLSALLWPAEASLPADSAFQRIALRSLRHSEGYPPADLGWMPSGAGGIVIVFLVASMLLGALAIKPLKVQI
jgi:hypothetical protein